MVRSELLQKLCNHHPNLLRKDIEKIFEIIFLEIVEALCREENIEIRGFGTFKNSAKKSQNGQKPQKVQKLVQIAEKKAIRWKMSKALFGRLNKNFTDNKISDTY